MLRICLQRLLKQGDRNRSLATPHGVMSLLIQRIRSRFVLGHVILSPSIRVFLTSSDAHAVSSAHGQAYQGASDRRTLL